MAFQSEYSHIYFFVPCPVRKKYEPDNEKKYSGFINLRIKCITDLHIGSGYRDFKNSSVLVQETVKFDGKPIIPGSTLKGTVRGLARAISSSCKSDRECSIRYDKFTKTNVVNTCITCDMFGIMGKSSKVIFTDFMPEDNVQVTVQKLNMQFGPNVNKDEKEGFKFYETLPNPYNSSSKTEAELISAGASFTGKVFFRELTEEELSLLMYSLSLNKAECRGINLKTGGFKNEGKGEIKAETIDFKVNNGMKKTPEELAENYNTFKTAVAENIELIEDKMRDGDD